MRKRAFCQTIFLQNKSQSIITDIITHVGGAAKVLKSFPVKQVLQSDYPKDSDEYSNYVDALEQASLTPTTVRETMTFSLDGVSYTVDPPKQETYSDQASNNSSLIISVEYGTRRFLFAGDAADARLQEFLAEDNGSYDFLKVPYHAMTDAATR